VTLLGSKFAVRSGGHSTNKGYASVDSSGVLIDLASLNQVTISPDKSYVSVGPGQHWENVYGPLEKQGLTVVGGRVAEVGVGGLMLGGMYCS
jgi:FAD/FMN-containing dehydrogenase